MSKKSDCHENGQDVLAVGPATEEGAFPYLRHRSDCVLEGGYVRPWKEGAPLMGGALIQVKPREDGTFEVLQEVKCSGPPKVSTPGYRRGWDRIFGGAPVVGEA